MQWPETELLDRAARIQAQAEVVDRALTRPALWNPGGGGPEGAAVPVYNRLATEPRLALCPEGYAWVCHAATGRPTAWDTRTRHDIATALADALASGEPVPLTAARLEFRLRLADPGPNRLGGAAALSASALLLAAGWRSTLVACMAPDPLGSADYPGSVPTAPGADETSFVRARLGAMERRSDAVARFRRREEALRGTLVRLGVAEARHGALLDTFDSLDAGALPPDPALRALLAVGAPWQLVAPTWGDLADRLGPQLDRLGAEEAAETGAAPRPRRTPPERHPPRPVASVVVPAFGDADTIGAVLTALERQDLDEPFEVVVVASGGDATPDIVRRGHPATLLLHSPDRLTPGAARNAGVDAATGREVIAFLAADCIPAPDWLRRRVEAHRRGHALVGGFVDAARPSTCAGWAQYFAKFWGMQGLHRARGEGPGPLFHLSYRARRPGGPLGRVIRGWRGHRLQRRPGPDGTPRVVRRRDQGLPRERAPPADGAGRAARTGPRRRPPVRRGRPGALLRAAAGRPADALRARVALCGVHGPSPAPPAGALRRRAAFHRCSDGGPAQGFPGRTAGGPGRSDGVPNASAGSARSRRRSSR